MNYSHCAYFIPPFDRQSTCGNILSQAIFGHLPDINNYFPSFFMCSAINLNISTGNVVIHCTWNIISTLWFWITCTYHSYSLSWYITHPCVIQLPYTSQLYVCPSMVSVKLRPINLPWYKVQAFHRDFWPGVWLSNRIQGPVRGPLKKI